MMPSSASMAVMYIRDLKRRYELSDTEAWVAFHVLMDQPVPVDLLSELAMQGVIVEDFLNWARQTFDDPIETQED